jgi:hypothetical protein
MTFHANAQADPPAAGPTNYANGSTRAAASHPRNDSHDDTQAAPRYSPEANAMRSSRA